MIGKLTTHQQFTGQGKRAELKYGCVVAFPMHFYDGGGGHAGTRLGLLVSVKGNCNATTMKGMKNNSVVTDHDV